MKKILMIRKTFNFVSSKPVNFEKNVELVNDFIIQKLRDLFDTKLKVGRFITLF